MAQDWLAKNDTTWLVDRLREKGPSAEHSLMIEFGMHLPNDKEALWKAADVLGGCYFLWVVGTLWRRSLGIHPGSGVETFLYGIKGEQQVPVNFVTVNVNASEVAA